MMDEETLAIFRQQVEALVDSLQDGLLALRDAPGDAELVNAVFRDLHTIKGTGGMFGHAALAAFIHGFESAFEAVRAGDVPVTPGLINVSLRARDHAVTLLETGTADPAREGEILEALAREIGGGEAPAAPGESGDAANSAPWEGPEGDPEPGELPGAEGDWRGADRAEAGQGEEAGIAAGQTPEAAMSEASAPPSNPADDPGDAPSAIGPSDAGGWQLSFRLATDTLALGGKPELLLDELRELGATGITADVSDLPPLDRFQPDHLYLGWQADLPAGVSEAAIRDVFLFHEDGMELRLERLRHGGDTSASVSGAGGDGPPADRAGQNAEDGASFAADLSGQAGPGGPIADDVPPASPSETAFDLTGPARGIPQPGATDPHAASETRLDPPGSARDVPQPHAPHPAPATDPPRPASDGTPPGQPPGRAASPTQPRPRAAPPAAMMRVSAERLDQMMDRVGELVIAEARLAELARASRDPALVAVAEDIQRLATGMRDATMSIRMTPIGTLTGRFRRLVHDLSDRLGKPVRFTVAGEETELDKTVVEQLSDPLVHVIRNAMDHGLEDDPAARTARGKPPEGQITLEARYSGAEVLISVADDGRGLDADTIRARAVERGLLAPQAELSRAETLALILEPGFSTAATITELSGRGVGMDVVKRTIEGLRGRIELTSEPGRGTRVTLRLPLTLAIIDGLLVEVAGERYTLPLAAVEEIVDLPEDKRADDGRARFLDIRGRLVPFLRLAALLEGPGAPGPFQKVVVVTAGPGRIGLVVDRIIGSNQTVIKQLSPLHAGLALFSGATILGDGNVALILDVAHLVDSARAGAADDRSAA